MRLGRVEVSAGCLLLLAWLNYWDTQGVVPLALAACLLHELAHYGALRRAGAGVRRVRLTAVGGAAPPEIPADCDRFPLCPVSEHGIIKQQTRAALRKRGRS